VKTCSWAILALVVLMSGCAPGYYEPRPANPQAAADYGATGTWYQNAETDEERVMRIWAEGARR